MSLEELQRKKSKTCTDYDTEERRLMDMLQQLENAEQERLIKLKGMMQDNTRYHHYAVGHVDHSKLSECYIDEMCCELFSSRPIQFHARKGEHYQVHREI